MHSNSTKSYYFTVIILFLAFIGVSQNCLPSGITFSTQSSVDNFSTNYEIIEYAQSGTTYPVNISLTCKSKTKFNKGVIKEFNFKMYSEDTLKYTEYGPNFWYYKL